MKKLIVPSPSVPSCVDVAKLELSSSVEIAVEELIDNWYEPLVPVAIVPEPSVGS